MNFLETYSKQEAATPAFLSKETILTYFGYLGTGVLTAVYIEAQSGHQEKIYKLADIDQKGPKSEKLFLGYLAKEHTFFQSDKGYVLGIVGDSEHYYPLPSYTERMTKYTSIPNPLPTYQVTWATTFFWIYLLGLIVIPPILVRVKQFLHKTSD